MIAPVRASAEWLELREPADAAARATDLVEEIRRVLPPRIVVHDLGCGTGSMARWLAPRLDGPQRWVMYDRDADLLARVPARLPAAAPRAITVETRMRDITQLDPGELAGASLITASALLDMLNADEIARLVATCVGAGCPALLTLSVIGRVELTPSDPLDETIAAAFNAHQRRSVGDRRLLGPDAAEAAAEAFADLGADVLVRPSPWRLGAANAALGAEWLDGWVGAACEQRPDLRSAARAYSQRRRAQLAAGRLRVIVHHHDLLARPR